MINKHYGNELRISPKAPGQKDVNYKNEVFNDLQDSIEKMDKDTAIQALKCLLREINGCEDHVHGDLSKENKEFIKKIRIITSNASKFFAVDKNRRAIIVLFSLCFQIAQVLEPKVEIFNNPTADEKLAFIQQVLLKVVDIDTGTEQVTYKLTLDALKEVFISNSKRELNELIKKEYLNDCSINGIKDTTTYFKKILTDSMNIVLSYLPYNNLEDLKFILNLKLVSNEMHYVVNYYLKTCVKSFYLSIKNNIKEILNNFIKHDISLEELNLFNSNITDNDLEFIVANFPNLRSLSLCHFNKIPNTGLQHLAKLDKLIILDLNGCKITDENLKYLSPLVELKSLKLSFDNL